MRGFVPTPPEIVDHMVRRLFRGRQPKRTECLLDPGCGTGAFLSGVMRWRRKNGVVGPGMVGIESEPGRARGAHAAFNEIDGVQIRCADFLTGPIKPFDFIVGNPPYVSIYNFSESEKREYRAAYETARGRFDLYLLFFERALKSLNPGGRMVFITPEKFLYVETAAPLRRLLSTVQIEEIELVDEQSFDGLVTYPTITTVVNRPRSTATLVRLRDGNERSCILEGGAASWMPIIRGVNYEQSHDLRLEDICIRVSCGVATGADDVFVRKAAGLDPELEAFARPTIAGRELTRPGEISQKSEYVMLTPYTNDAALLAPHQLGPLGNYLSRSRERLMKRHCVKRKPWYAFHETPPLPGILRPKILCKDIAEKPYFWIDRTGALVPRHSVYYIVPADVANIERLCSYLNSQDAARWLSEHCQRAASGFLRLQSNILKTMPIPGELAHQRRHHLVAKRQLELPRFSGSESAAAR
ncbi:MAG: Eco57I restriction-modification methylase domain-containing protein [Candidatus Binataceae bacterium]